MKASPSSIYLAWTEEFDKWFAAPGQILMRAVVGEPYVFNTLHEGTIHPHYGRFLRLERDTLVEMTWMTGRAGTEGAETMVTLELSPHGETGTDLVLTHAGFYDDEAVSRHDGAWEHHVLPHLDDVLTGDQPA